MVKRQLLVQAVAKAISTEKPVVVSNCSSPGPNDNFVVPKGMFLYGLKLNDGRYVKIVASDMCHAAKEAGVKLEEIKRALPLRMGKE